MSYIAMSPDDERQDVEKARAILIKLTPATGDSGLIKSALRYVSRLLADATAQGSSDATLNNLRGEVSIALNHLIGSLESHMLTQDIIDKATRAVDALLKGFDQQNG
jgi:hypothetical protein